MVNKIIDTPEKYKEIGSGQIKIGRYLYRKWNGKPFGGTYYDPKTNVGLEDHDLNKFGIKKESTDLRKFYKLDKTILPRNIAIDYGVTVSVIRSYDHENNLVSIEGDERDLETFIDTMDLEEVEDEGVEIVDPMNEEMMGVFSVDPFEITESAWDDDEEFELDRKIGEPNITNN